MERIDSANAIQEFNRTDQSGSAGMNRWLVQAWLTPVVQQTLREAKEKGTLKRLGRDLVARGSYFRTIAEEAPVGIFYTDARGRCLYVNRQWHEMTGLTRPETSGGGWARALHPEERDLAVSRWHRGMASGEMLRDEFRLQCSNGKVMWVLSQCVPVHDETSAVAGYIGTFVDITEQKRLLEALIESKNIFARQLLKGQEEERRRIARELHDEMGQTLTALKIGLQELQHESVPDRARLQESTGLIDHLMEQVRALLTDLRPAPLETLGLPAALRWYLSRQGERTGLKIQFHVDTLPGRLPGEVEIGCFRIVQEALTNVIRHAQAQHVTIDLRQEETALRLWIKDDGVGFDVDAARDRSVANGNWGIVGMQERAHLAGGNLCIESTAQHGTRVSAWFPLSDR